MRYPTGDKLTDQLCEFFGARWPTILGPMPEAHNGKPPLAEDWWVEANADRKPPLPKLSAENALRCIYRWARNRNVMTGGILTTSTEAAADLMLHQIDELPVALVSAWRGVSQFD